MLPWRWSGGRRPRSPLCSHVILPSLGLAPFGGKRRRGATLCHHAPPGQTSALSSPSTLGRSLNPPLHPRCCSAASAAPSASLLGTRVAPVLFVAWPQRHPSHPGQPFPEVPVRPISPPPPPPSPPDTRPAPSFLPSFPSRLSSDDRALNVSLVITSPSSFLGPRHSRLPVRVTRALTAYLLPSPSLIPSGRIRRRPASNILSSHARSSESSRP